MHIAEVAALVLVSWFALSLLAGCLVGRWLQRAGTHPTGPMYYAPSVSLAIGGHGR